MHMVWDTYRRDFRWTLPLAEQWGYHRGSGPLIISDGLRGHTVRMPTGQTTPWHHAARDMLFIGGKLPPGKKGTYYAEDPGWPVRADAATIEVFVDQHGDAKVVDKAKAAG